MSEKNLFGEDWLDLQRRYWDSWSEMSRKALGLADGLQGQADAGTVNPWASALDHWWQAWAPAAPDASRQVVEKIIDQGTSFFRIAEAFMPSSGNANGDGMMALSKTLEDLQSRFMSGMEDGGDSFHRMMAFWELPYDNWQRIVSSLSPIPGDVLRNMPHDHVRGHMDKLLSAPGLGYTREEQGQYQELGRATLNYQKALREYLNFFGQLGVKSIARMRSYIQSVIESGKSIDSARAIYDNWVRCCESVYAEEVGTPEYAQIHANLVNSQLAVKQRMSYVVDESLGAMNMPTRGELRTLQNRLQETRRDNKKMRRELDALHRQAASLAAAQQAQARARASSAAAPAARPATPQKKAVAKPAVAPDKK